jgi:hypothetical protein
VAAIGTDAAQELARKSGLTVQIDSLASQVRAGMSDALDKNGAGVTAAQRARLLDCAQPAFAADGLRAIAVDAVAGALDPAEVTPLLAWYDSPLGRKIAAAEESSAGQMLEPQERLRRGAQALDIASPARKAALQAILSETHSVEIMADTLIGMAFAVQQGVAALDPAVNGAAIANIRAGMEARRPQLVQHYAQISLPAYAFTYGKLEDDELRQYAEHLTSASARSFNDASARGVARSLASGSANLGRCLKDGGSKS